ncbi:MAG: ATP-dependent endonuclease [Marmoricola sp.]|nr:ATP-dependent endonuclease [Marmoricola sp.]
MTPPRAVVLVEGDSDRVALLALARRRDRDLPAEGVEVLAVGGVTNIGAAAARHGPRGRGLQLAGLYDAPEEEHVRRGLRRAGLGVGPGPDALAWLDFHRCTADLEDELLRALGVRLSLEVVEAAGELRSYRLLAQMPAQEGWTGQALLHRFLGVRSGRKARYAELLVDALPLERVPAPLDAVLDAVAPRDRRADR